MPEYHHTLSSAGAYAEEENLKEWIKLYFEEKAGNYPLKDDAISAQFYFGPANFPLRLFKRWAGPEREMKCVIDRDRWSEKITDYERQFYYDVDVPPLIAGYKDNTFELIQGNHLHRAYEKLGFNNAWAVICIAGRKDMNDFMTQ